MTVKPNAKPKPKKKILRNRLPDLPAFLFCLEGVDENPMGCMVYGMAYLGGWAHRTDVSG